jgi:hypothetical protein
MTFKKAREMLLSFGIKNDNLAVFICNHFESNVRNVVRTALVMNTTLSTMEIEEKAKQIVTLYTLGEK